MLQRAADRLVPGLGKDSAAAYGALHMRAAVLAGRIGRIDLAHDHIEEASDVARFVNDGVYRGTLFGPASVRIHQLTLAVDAGDPDAALRAIHSWSPPASMPAERRSHFFVDLARALAQTGAPARSLRSLGQARQIAPEHIRVHPDVRQLLTSLASASTIDRDQFAELAGWVGLADLAA